MSKAVEDLQMLRLIKAFQRVRDGDARRKIVLYVEEEAQREAQLKTREPAPARS
ncbi:hypothetical protein ABIB73_006057 [Bradyrhizobium sp. F1.4.3]|uniref:hypothetical protein n=1 Tax=Bradyrhizobium sp. F1.4.3 TaxID=3156356 RepID=UPI003390EB5C